MNSTDTNTYQYINLDYLHLMTDGDDEMKVMMIEMLFDEPVEEMEKMIELEKEKNWNELKAVSHKMKSTLAFVGCEPLTNANKEIEQIAINQDKLERLPELLANVKDLFTKALAELRIELNKTQG